MQATSEHPTMMGALWASAAMVVFSMNDVIIKFLSGGYALHEVILIRSLIALVVLIGVIVPLSGGLAQLRTRRIGLHLLRGLCVVFNNVCFFLGLAELPLGEAVAIFFVAPLLISLFSILFLGEKVGPRRWAAILVGLVGVIVVLRPGGEAFRVAALLPLAAATGYALLTMLTRRLGPTESASSLAFWIQMTFLVTSACFGLALGHGTYAGTGHPSLEFLFRAWIWPASSDWALLALLGLVNALGGFFISQAYRISEAGLVAPFEYIAMPIAVFWGFTVFGEWPDLWAWLGIGLILGSGLFLIWRETMLRRRARR